MTDYSIPYDPDFDDEPSAEAKRNNMSPRTAFVAGLATSILAFGTIGFLLLLFLLFR